MLQLISVDSRLFTHPVGIGKDHGQMLIKSAQHSLEHFHRNTWKILTRKAASFEEICIVCIVCIVAI